MGGSGNAMTESFCQKLVDKYDEQPYFNNNGGMKQFGKAVKRGMTFVISFWDDMATNMNWLDTGSRGTCDPEDGDPKNLREKHPDAAFSVRHMRWGPIGSTHKSSEAITFDSCILFFVLFLTAIFGSMFLAGFCRNLTHFSSGFIDRCSILSLS